MKKLRSFFFVVIIVCASVSYSHAGELEKYFSEAQKAYKANRLDEAAAGFTKVSELLKKKKQNAQAGLVLGNIAGIRIKQENYQEAVNIYLKTLTLADRKDSAFRARIINNMAFCYYKLGDHARRAECLRQLMDEKLVTDKAQQANVLSLLGDSHKEMEYYAVAAEYYEKAAAIMSADSSNLGRLYAGWGMCASALGEFLQAEELFQKARELAEPGDALNNAEILSNLGIIKWELGEYEAASKFIEQAISLESASGFRRNEGVDYNNLGLVKKSAGLHDNALGNFEKSLAIAREVKNVRDEAIALSNIALVKRIEGDYAHARQYYAAALELFRQCDFQEGVATTLLGQGKLYEIADLDYAKALECYREALTCYEALSMRRGMAEALNQIGRVLKKTANPKRVSRDLVFSDEPFVMPQLSAEQAREESRKAYSRALAIASEISSRELIWTACQGLGNAFREEGRLQEAFDSYEKAVAIVTGLRCKDSDTELLAEYLLDKKDLFTEAMELCYELYRHTGDKKFMFRALELDEILRNEIIKANTSLVRLEFADAEKNKLYNEIFNNVRRRGGTAGNGEAADTSEAGSKESEIRRERARKLDEAFEELLALWKTRYPEDAVLFDSNARIDTDQIRAVLADNEIVLNYISLPDSLIILSIAKEAVNIYTVSVAAETLDEKIKKDFLVEIIEAYRDVDTPEKEVAAMHKSTAFFREMYHIVMEPVESEIRDKKRLIITASGFLAQLPFAALVTEEGDPMRPHYLAEDKEVELSRLSFFTGREPEKVMNGQVSLLAAGNPRNSFVDILAPLPAAEEEVRKVSALFGVTPDSDSVKYQYDATETWFKNTLAAGGYDMLYMATHGMPFADTFTFYRQIENIRAKGRKVPDRAGAQYDYMHSHLPGMSMLNGYIYMAASDSDDGFLTLREIMELPVSSFNNTHLVILSACNTGVTFAPKALKNNSVYEALTSDEVEMDLRRAGWVPGVDQVSFVDTFMKRGVDYTFGTLWFADDRATGYILSEFAENMKTESVVSAYSSTIRRYLKDSAEGRNPLGNNYTTTPQHPYFWAVGAIFGH